jgi:hypothetical protein
MFAQPGYLPTSSTSLMRSMGESSYPVGSLAYLSEPFTLPGIGKDVTLFKFYATGLWGSQPGNEWGASSISNLIAWGAKIDRIETPAGMTEKIPVDPKPEPEPEQDTKEKTGPEYTPIKYTTNDPVLPPDNSDRTAEAMENAGKMFTGLAITGAVVTACFFIGRALFKKWG